MTTYLVQSSLADLEAAARSIFDGISWVKAWYPKGGDLYVGEYASGTAVFGGAISIGNPNKPWIEVQVSHPDVLAELGAAETKTLKSAVRNDAVLRALYRASGRGLIRNGLGNPVGVMPTHVISGTDPRAAFLDGEDPDEAQELLDLEP